MKQIKLIFIFLVIIFLFSGSLFSQIWLRNQLINQKVNFFDVQKSNQDYWSKKDSIPRSKGFKPFKRWEWFWEPRTYPTGNFPSLNHLFEDYFNNNTLTNNTKTKENIPLANSSWINLGPTNAEGGYWGLGRVNCTRISPSNLNTIYSGSASGGLWKSTDGGSHWSTVNDSIMSMSLGISDILIQKDNSNIIYIATGDCDAGATYSIGVIKSTNGGTTWQKTGLYWNTSQTKKIYKLATNPTNSKIIYAAGTNGIDKTTNAGVSWTNILQGTFYDVKIKPDDGNTVYAAGQNTIYFSIDGGDTWQQPSGLPTSGIARIALAVTSVNVNNVYAIISNSTDGFLGFFVSTNAGYTWQNKCSNPNLLGWMSSGSDEGGQGLYDLCIAVSPVDENLVYVGGVNVWKSTNMGTDWNIETMWYQLNNVSTIHADQHDLFFISDNSIYASNDGGVYKKIEGDNQWKWLGDGLQITQFYRLGSSVTNDSLIIAGSQDNGTKLYNGTFTNIKGSDGMNCLIDYSNSSILYASTGYGGIAISTDNGKNFVNIKPPSANGSWVTPFLLDPSNPQTLLAAFQEVYKSTDRGNSWSVISNFGLQNNKTLVFLAISPSNGNVIYAGTGNGILKRTTDGGSNWTLLNIPDNLWLTSIAVHPADSNRIWASFSGFKDSSKVYYSADGGINWQNYSTGLPNAPANCLVYEKNSPDRLYLGTDIGVYYRDLTKNKWLKYSDGLPNVVITDLDIQYHAKKLRAATYGRGLWETGLVPTVIEPEITGNFDLCLGNTEIYKSNSFSGVNNSWVVTGGKVIGASNLDSIQITWTDTLNAKIWLIQSIPNAGIKDSIYKNVIVYSNPQPVISGADTTCPNAPVTYTCNFNPIINNKWNVTGGKIIGSDNSKSVVIQWNNSATGTVSLLQTSRETGCNDTAYKQIVIKSIQKPLILGLNPVCSNSIALYNTNTNSGFQNSWSLENGIIIKNYNDSIKVFWNDTIAGSVTLTQTDNSTGCYDSTTYNIIINKIPFKNIDGNFVVCLNNTERYSAILNQDYSYKWVVDDSSFTGSDTLSDFDVKWTNTGIKKLSLGIINKITGCSFDTTINITVKNSPKPAITGNNNICRNSEGIYSINTFSGNRLTWTCQGGNITGSNSDSSVVIKWVSSGLASVKVIQTDLATSCADSTIYDINVEQLPSSEFLGADTVCPGCIEKYFAIQSNMNNLWSVIGGTIQGNANEDSVRILWGSLGKGRLTLIHSDITTNCMDSAVKSIEITNRSLPVISGNREVCSQTEEIYSTSTNTDFLNLWSAINGDIEGKDNLSYVKIMWGNSGTGTLKLEQTNTKTTVKQTNQFNVLINQKPLQPTISRIGYTLKSSAESGNIWYFESTPIAGVNTQIIEPEKDGYYSLQVIDTNNCLSDTSAKYLFSFSSVPDIGENEFIIYPNPASEYINISFKDNTFSDYSIDLNDILGKTVFSKTLNIEQRRIQIPANINSGVYLLTIKTYNQIYRTLLVLDR